MQALTMIAFCLWSLYITIPLLLANERNLNEYLNPENNDDPDSIDD